MQGAILVKSGSESVGWGVEDFCLQGLLSSTIMIVFCLGD